MNMQKFYRRLSIKSSQAHQRRLTDLTQVSRLRVLNATRAAEWFIWREETPNA